MASWIDSLTDAQLAREVTGPGQIITRTPSQIAAYRAQQSAQGSTQMSLSDFLRQMAGGGSNPYQPGVMNTSNRFEAGLGDAETRLRALLDNPDSVQQSAAYKFRVGQGQEALQRQMGAKGLLNSGNRLTELTKYGQDMGSQEYENQAKRLSDLVGGYSGSWIGDKNANTGAFAAQSGAWNTAQKNMDTNKLGYANIWAEMNRNPQDKVLSRGTSTWGGIPTPTGYGVY